MNQLPFFRGWAQLARGQHFHYFRGGTRRTICKLWASGDSEIRPAQNQTDAACEQDCPNCRRRLRELEAKGVKV